jgi:hypothetical protein
MMEINDTATITVTVKPPSVPDTGTTALLGLIACGGLGFLRRLMK